VGHFFAPKTRESVRRIDLSPLVAKALAEWKLASKAQEIAKKEKHGGEGLPAKYADLDLVFPNEEGGPMNYINMVQRHYRKALRDAEIPQIRFHDLRHTYARLLLLQVENVKYVQTQLGHSRPTVKSNVYAHLKGKIKRPLADWKTPFFRQPVTIFSQKKQRG